MAAYAGAVCGFALLAVARFVWAHSRTRWTPLAVADEWATAAVAGEAGWPVRVFGGDAKPGLALLC